MPVTKTARTRATSRDMPPRAPDVPGRTRTSRAARVSATAARGPSRCAARDTSVVLCYGFRGMRRRRWIAGIAPAALAAFLAGVAAPRPGLVLHHHHGGDAPHVHL